MKKLVFLLGALLLCLFAAHPVRSQTTGGKWPKTPLAMESLKETLSYVRGDSTSETGWPRVIKYKYETYDYRTERFAEKEKIYEVTSKPLRIIPHAVGVTEILWAICPRERIVAYNELAADPEFCILADLVKKKGPIFRSKQVELVIGYQPDLVLTVFYSGADFKEKLENAKIPYFDLGYFGAIESIKKQILVIGKIIGEEGNAEALVRVMEERIQELKAKLPKTDTPIRLLYYDNGGYIPGKSSNFTSICELIEVVNVGAEQGIKSWRQIDFETLLKWDPDFIILPQGSKLKEHLIGNEILSHARAIKNDKVFYVPRVYMGVDSQYIILTANLLAGIIYENVF